MKATTVAALGVMVLGSASVIAWKFAAPILEKRAQIETSDAVKSKGTISIGVDNFLGYYILCSPYQRSQMRNAGYELRCVDDDADYGRRIERLRKGEIQLAVATIDSYELNGVEAKFPGLIIAVIDRSSGADAIIARTSKVKNIDDLKRGGLKVAFAAGSPSEHLLKVIAADFDIPQWRAADKSWRVEVKSSQEAAKKFAAGDVDVAVLWEPDVTRTLRSNSDAIKVIGTEVAPRAIVDVLIARREYVRDNREAVKVLLQTYFKSAYYYRTNPEIAAAHAAEYAKIGREHIADALRGVAWANLVENATLWFGTPEPGQQPQFGLIDAIESTTRILVEHGDFKASPLPNDNPRSIILSEPIDELYQSGLASGEKVDPKSGDSLTREFPELTDAEWNALREIGTLRVRPIGFPSGADTLSADAKEKIDRIAETIKNYPDFRIVVEGHTSTRGDPTVNLELSQERAEAVARYLMVTYGIRQGRIRAAGYGGTKPLPRRLDETDREYMTRLSRVVVKMVTEAY
jgi:outer membrane protein OmpA-like peptidoglycan-associated protein/ABC-type nitrate/sulfonate/bicarbonate transport system substrate-binding protein